MTKALHMKVLSVRQHEPMLDSERRHRDQGMTLGCSLHADTDRWPQSKPCDVNFVQLSKCRHFGDLETHVEDVFF